MKKRLRIFSFVAFTVLSISASAITYTFTGNGSWATASNWQGGFTPGYGNEIYIGSSDTVIITGTCSVPIDFRFLNYGLVWVKPTGIFNIQALVPLTSDFINEKEVHVDGILNNDANFRQMGLVNVTGTFKNYSHFFDYSSFVVSSFVLRNGSFFENTTSGWLQLNRVVNETGSTFTNNGSLFNTIVFSGGGLVINARVLAPGNSPGTITVNGSYTATSTAVHNFEIGGTAANSYDRLIVGGTVNLDGSMNISLINGHTPQSTHNIPIITGTISGTFATVNLPASYFIAYTSSGVFIRGSAVLPVTFVNLTASKVVSGTQLNWIIENQTNIQGYDVEKSLNGSTFIKIASVPAGAQSRYSYTDPTQTAKAFYRIRSKEITGGYGYSSIVKYSDGGSIIVIKTFPNPATNSIILQHATATVNSRITVFSALGKAVLVYSLKTGVQQTNLNVSSLSSGNYMIKFEDGKQTETIHFTKL